MVLDGDVDAMALEAGYLFIAYTSPVVGPGTNLDEIFNFPWLMSLVLSVTGGTAPTIPVGRIKALHLNAGTQPFPEWHLTVSYSRVVFTNRYWYGIFLRKAGTLHMLCTPHTDLLAGTSGNAGPAATSAVFSWPRW
jgi:hypothetical protein